MERNNHSRQFDLIELERRAALVDTAHKVAQELRRQALADAWLAVGRAATGGARRVVALMARMLHRHAPAGCR